MPKTYGKFTLSLTGKDSHKVNITPGQGRFTIAPKTSGEKADAYVDADTPIQWEVFNDFKVPAGGNWPRVMDYVGNDTRFIKWIEQREMESFDSPQATLCHLKVSPSAIYKHTQAVHCRLKERNHFKITTL